MRSLQLLHLASMLGMILIFGVFFFLLEPDYGWSFDLADWNFSTSLIAVLACHYLGNRFYQKRMERVRGQSSDARWDMYRTSVITRLALLEMAVLITLILFLVNANTVLLISFAVGVLLFAQARPSVDQFRKSA